MNQRNNTRGLQREIAKKISKSEMWLVLRVDNEGSIHLHTPNEDHITLFGLFFKRQPELLEEIVNEIVKDIQKQETL